MKLPDGSTSLDKVLLTNNINYENVKIFIDDVAIGILSECECTATGTVYSIHV